jgi:23S rRNA C2498 (ribose-2'-O)-methylase RlmM
MMVEKANAELALLTKYVDDYDSGKDQDAALEKIAETLKKLKAMESELENEEDRLDGDELKEMRIAFRQFKKDLKQILRENSVLKDVMDKIENPGQSSQEDGADGFFGD